MTLTRLNPETLHRNPAFTQVVVVTDPGSIIYVGGQNGVDAAGRLVGSDIASQTEQTFHNLIAALAAAGATYQDVVKLTIYIVQGQSVQAGFSAAQRVPAMNTPPPAISVVIVAGLANPAYLIENDAVAVLGRGADHE